MSVSVFDQHFSQVYGPRWQQLSLALSEVPKKCARRNGFYPDDSWAQEAHQWVDAPLEGVPFCFELKQEVDWAHLGENLRPFYRMDPASVLAARALGVKPGERVLDMCAAPGGKSLILFEALCGLAESSGGEANPQGGQLVVNELSAKRRHRLMSVVKTHVPQSLRRHIEFRGRDGSIMGLKEKQVYDKILLDAPCSGERGLMERPSELSQWKPKRSQGFALRQYALLASAFHLLKPGGRLVYSTCSISQYENDGVIAKLIKKRPKLEGDFKILKEASLGEATDYGYRFLPDGPNAGWGPIYYTTIEKVKS